MLLSFWVSVINWFWTDLQQILNFSNNIFVINDRIENIAHNASYRNNFDIGATRAVGSPSTVAEYILPMLNRSGLGLLYCGKWEKKDEVKIRNSLKILKGSITDIKKTQLPNRKGDRNIIFIKTFKGFMLLGIGISRKLAL